MTDLCIVAVLGDLSLSSGVRIPEHGQVIASGRQLALTAGSGALQGCMVALQVPMLRQKGLPCSELHMKASMYRLSLPESVKSLTRVCSQGYTAICRSQGCNKHSR